MITREPYRILIVDDDDDFRTSLTMRLDKRGYRVRGVSGGSEGLKQVVTEEYDAIVCDIKMVGMSGIDFLQELHNLEVDIPVIMLTGYGSLQSAREALVQRAFDYLLKPLGRIDELIRPLDQAAAQHRLRMANRRLEAEKKEMARRLEDANQELEHFAAIASHDLQEPLRMIASYLQLIESRYDELLDSDGHEFIEYAVGGARRLKMIIDDLLEYALHTRPHPVGGSLEVDAVLDEVLAELEPIITAEGAEVTRDPLPSVFMEPVALRLLLTHLLKNSVQFHSSGSPKIHVSSREDGDVHVISVSDNGKGIPTPFQGQIFNLFRRFDTPDKPGTGAGLAISKKIVESHGGRIWFESEEDRGTTFFFTLPIRRPRSLDPRPRLWEPTPSEEY